MLRLERSILLDLCGIFLLALVLVTAVLFAGLSLQTMGQTQGLGLSFLLSLLPALLPTAVAHAAPYAFLLSVAAVYGRIVADREWTAYRASGVHPITVAMPAIALGAIIAVGSLVAAGWLVPAAAQAVRMQKRNLVDLFLGQIASSDRRINLYGCRFSYGSYEPGGVAGGIGVFHDAQLDFRSKKTGELIRMIVADEVSLVRSGGTLRVDSPDAYVIEASLQGAPSVRRSAIRDVDVGSVTSVGGGAVQDADELRRVGVGHVESLGASVAFNDLVGGGRFDRKERDVDLPDLLYLVARGDVPSHDFLADGEQPEIPRTRALVELHARLSGAMTPLLFGLVAVAAAFQLSERSRRLTGFLCAFGPAAILHFPLSVAGRSLALGGKVPPAVGMWGPDVVLLLVGLLLLVRASRR